MRTLRERLSDARQMYRYRHLAVSGRERSAYIGWLGHRNAGDDAMYLAHERLFPDAQFWNVPNVAGNPGLDLVARWRGAALPPVTFLGGGTLIGNGHFRRTAEAWFAAVPDSRAVMLSVGVEDPDFDGPRGRDSDVELGIWGEVLQRFDQVRVRGPLSQEILRRYGIGSTIVGDPALLLGEGRGFNRVEERVLGLNIGQTDDMWGEQEEVVNQACALVRTMVSRDWTIRVFSVWPKDDAIVRTIAAAGGASAQVVSYAGDVEALIDDLGRCTVFVGEKLHSVVLATCAQVPSIALEYRPKCRDFQASVGREQLTMRTDKLDLHALVEMIDDLAASRDASSHELRRIVDARRDGIRLAASQMREAGA